MSPLLVSASPSHGATHLVKGKEETTTIADSSGSMLRLQPQRKYPQQKHPWRESGGANGIEIYIHSPTTTTSSGADEDGDGGEQMERGNQAMTQYNRPKTFRKLSNSSSIISEIFRQPDDELSEHRLRVKIKQANDRDNSRDLIEFLRTTSPPPPRRRSRLSLSLVTNGKNRGSSSSSSHSGRNTARIPFWAVCRRLKARRSNQRVHERGRGRKERQAEKSVVMPDPPLLKLPDTAVAGRTIGGHRHIAISIPIEYDHLGEEPQLPAAASTISVGRATTPGSPSIGTYQVPPRVSSATANSRGNTALTPADETKSRLRVNTVTRSHISGGSSPFLSRQPDDTRPRTAESHGGVGQRSTIVRFNSSSPLDHHDSAMETRYPAAASQRSQRSFGYTGDIGIHESPDGVSVRRHHHWSWPPGGPHITQQEQTSNMPDNSPEVMLVNAMALHGFSARFSPHGHEQCCSELRRVQSMSMLSFPRHHNVGIGLTTPGLDLKAQKSMARLSYHEIINHNHHNGPTELSSSGSGDEQGGNPAKSSHTLRSLTLDLPPAYRAAATTSGVAKAMGNKHSSNIRSSGTTEQPGSEVQDSEPLRFSSIMTVTDVKPSFSSESLPVMGRVEVHEEEALDPQPSKALPVYPRAETPVLSSPPRSTSSSEEEEDGESTPRAASTFASFSERKLHQNQTPSPPPPPPPPATIIYHHRPSIEQILFPTANSSSGRSPTTRLVDVISPSLSTPILTPTNPRPAAPTPARAGAGAEILERSREKQAQTAGRVSRSESHQALAKQYAALRRTCDQELTILLDRLERLENKNDWWLNSVVPMMDNMTRRLTRIYDDDSLSRLARERARTLSHAGGDRSGDRAVSGASAAIHRPLHDRDEDLETSTSFDSFLPPLSPFGHRRQSATTPSPWTGTTSVDRNRHSLSQSLLEPESSFESFDSFNFDRHQYLSQLCNHHSNHPFTSVAPPSPATQLEPEPEPPSPYPYPYIYPGEVEADEMDALGERLPCSTATAVPAAGPRLRYNNSTDSLPQDGFTGLGMGMDMRSSISSNFDQPLFGPPQEQRYAELSQETPERYRFNQYFDFGHGMGLAVDRLPSRHGERGLLNTIVIPGGGNSNSGASRLGSGSNSPYTRKQQPRSLYSSARDPTESQFRIQSPKPPLKSRSRPQSLFIPRRVDYIGDDDHDDEDQEYYDEDEDKGGLESSGNIFGGGKDRPVAGSNEKLVGDNQRKVRFLNQGVGPAPKPRPVSWPSPCSPLQVQTRAQTRAAPAPAPAHQPRPRPYIHTQASTQRRPEVRNDKRLSSGDCCWNHHHHSQQHQQQQRQTEWDTLEPLMRGLMETTRLDLELGRGLNLDLDQHSDTGFSEST